MPSASAPAERGRCNAERKEQAGDQRKIQHQLEGGGGLDHGEVAAGIFEHHGLVHHGELEMGRRIVDRDPGVLRDPDEDQREPQARERPSGPLVNG